MPGRKSDVNDVNDAQWLQRFHACGLLRGSFRPDRQIAELRSYLRLRERHSDYAASHIQHMLKALTPMNLQLHHVVSDVTGATGLRIARAILAGERDPKVLAKLRDIRCHASAETVQGASPAPIRCRHPHASAAFPAPAIDARNPSINREACMCDTTRSGRSRVLAAH